MEIKLFELNGVDITPYTHKITDLQEADAEAMASLGDELKLLVEKSPGIRTITWEGNVTNEADYLKLRRHAFGSQQKVLKLSPSRQINLTGLKIKNERDIKEPQKTKLTITLLAADPLEYNVTESSAEKTVTASGDTIIVQNNGEAPTIPEWTITASAQIVNPLISDSEGNKIAWLGILAAGDVLKIRSDGTVTKNGVEQGSAIGMPLAANPGQTIFTYSDDSTSSHSCVLKATWRDAYY